VSHVAPCSHSHPFDTALRVYSGQAEDLQDATSEPACAWSHADRPDIRVAECYLMINQWHLLLWPWGDLSACLPACTRKQVRTGR
jgi:hypothetical protein